MNTNHFWEKRSKQYNELNWVNDTQYKNDILRLAELRTDQLVLDVGAGNGVIAKAVKPLVRHVVALDISESMLKIDESWKGISVVQWDIVNPFFADGTFDRIFARMVFHHLLNDDLGLAITRCHSALRKEGKLIIAEGVPPTNDPLIVDWYTEMFKYKEDRRTFTPESMTEFLKEGGFSDISCHIYYMDNFSIGDWLKKSGIDTVNQDTIMRMHLEADPRIKEAYNMRITDNDCIVRTKNIIWVGEKH